MEAKGPFTGPIPWLDRDDNGMYVGGLKIRSLEPAEQTASLLPKKGLIVTTTVMEVIPADTSWIPSRSALCNCLVMCVILFNPHSNLWDNFLLGPFSRWGLEGKTTCQVQSQQAMELLSEPVSADCRSSAISTSLSSSTVQLKPWLLWAPCLWNYRKLSAHQVLWKGFAGAEGGQVPPRRDREKWEKTLLIHEVSGRPDSHSPGPSPARWGTPAPGMRPISLHHVCFYYWEECSRVASSPYFIPASVWSAGMKTGSAR